MYIDAYLTQSELSTQASFRTLLKEMGKSDVYHVHGSKLFPRHRSTSAGRRGRDQRAEDSGQSHGSSRSDRRQRNRSHDRSTESSRRGQRLREGRSSSLTDHMHRAGVVDACVM